MDGLLLVKLSWLTVVLLGLVQGEDLAMDSVVNCGRTVHIYDREYTITTRADITTTNPDYRCILFIDSGYSDSYHIQITQQMVAIEDCGVKLTIYDGSSAWGTAITTLGCTTKSTDILYSKYDTITIEFITPKVIYSQRNDFRIKVKAFQIPRLKTTTYVAMDSVVNCGRTVHIYDREYTIKARDDITTTKPDYRCILVIDSGYSDSYLIQITQHMVAIEDCGISLNIYEGSSAWGTTVKKLGCTTKSTDILYSKYGTITFEFITPKEVYNQRNDFSITVQAFRDPNAPAYAEGGSRLPAGAIGGIVVVLVVLIAFTIILLWCYKARRLPGMSKYRKHAISMQTFFATDASVMQHYYPPNQYEVQNQVYPIIGYDAFGNPVYGNPVQSAMPYTQAGQPVYYVDQNGYPVDPQQQPMQYQTPTDFHPEMPPPYHNAIVATPGAPSPIMPAGNILDDPRIPPPGTTLMNSGVDPHTGVRSSQVVWTDANPDPTDPTGDNPQIKRETIV